MLKNDHLFKKKSKKFGNVNIYIYIYMLGLRRKVKIAG